MTKKDFYIGDFLSTIKTPDIDNEENLNDLPASDAEKDAFDINSEATNGEASEGTEDESNKECRNEQEEKEFFKLCQSVQNYFNEKWEKSENMVDTLELQKNAIIGLEKEVLQLKGEIKDFLLKSNRYNTPYPSYYQFSTLESAVFDELFGFAGLSEWFSPGYKFSSSAKVIGDRIYFLEKGRMVLKKQRIGKERRDQLIRAMLLPTPEERIDKPFHEVYTSTHDRVTIFTGDMVKDQEDVLIFRRYTIPNYTFDEQISRHTIPADIKPFFLDMIKLGYNCAFTGAVRTAKTTFLSTWLMYEDPTLEGVLVETDPEIPIAKMLPSAPIIQLIADGDELKHISKNLLRADGDMLIMGEARDGIALDIAVRIANKGTRRVKITFHTRDPIDFCYDIASEITKMLGGDTKDMAKKVAKSFDYLFHFVQLKDKNQKRLNAIYELSYDYQTDTIMVKEICRYNYNEDNWGFCYVISDDKKRAGLDEDPEAFKSFDRNLKELAKMHPLENPKIIAHKY
jgi:pilus assembly protein CpaF